MNIKLVLKIEKYVDTLLLHCLVGCDLSAFSALLGYNVP